MDNVLKIFDVLNGSERKRLVLLLGLLCIGMLLETIGVGLIIPLLMIVGESDIAGKYPLVQPLLNAIGNPSQTRLVVLGLLVMLAFFGFKNLFLAFINWQRAYIISSIQAELSKRLFKAYLRQPYSFHLQHNSSILMRNVVAESNQFTNGMSSLLDLVANGLVMLGVGTLLLVVEPIGGLVALSLLGVAGGLFQIATKKRVRRWGEARRFHQGRIVQHLQQGLGGVKDIKILGREQEFLFRFNAHAAAAASVERKRRFLSGLPRLWFEFLAVLGLVVLVVSLLAQDRQVDAIIPTLAVFAAAAFRLMPKMGLVTTAAQEWRFSAPVIENVHAELHELEQYQPETWARQMPFEHEIRLAHIGFTYLGASTPTLRNISLTIERGSSVGFVGGSGAGKSTLIDLILGLMSPSEGQILVDGTDIQSNLRGWQDQIGYVPQHIFLSDESLRRNIAFGVGESDIDDEAVMMAAKAAHLEDFLATLPEGLDTQVGERGVRLSGGQRQRVGIARALYHDPAVLVLDEATSALDTPTEARVMEAVNSLHGVKTILIVAHRLTTVSKCDKLFRVDKGTLERAGSFNEIVNA